MLILKTNTATRITVGPFLDETDGVTPKTALTVTDCKLTMTADIAGVPTLQLDTNPTASGGSNDMVHITNDDAGMYDLELTASNLNFVGNARVMLTDAANHCPVWHDLWVVPGHVYDSWHNITGAAHTWGIVDQGTAQAATGSTIQLRSAAAFADDELNGAVVVTTGGTGVGQTRIITDYVSATDTATVSPNWTTTPSGTIEYKVFASAPPATAAAALPSVLLAATGSAALTEAYPADGAAGTIAELLYLILAHLQEKSVSGTTVTLKKLDGSTTAATLTLDDATDPTSVTRSG